MILIFSQYLHLNQFDCPSDRYCSTKRHKCFRKLKLKKSCSRDYACRTGYCGRVSHGCARKKTEGRKCFASNAACNSGYCDSATGQCSSLAEESGKCHENSGCKSGYCKANGQCGTDTGPNPPDPEPPQPTGRSYI